MKQNLKFEPFTEFIGKPMTELYDHLQKNYTGKLAKEEDLTEENIPKDSNWYYAFGSLRYQPGKAIVPTVNWYGDKLHRNAGWLKDDFYSVDRVVLLETADNPSTTSGVYGLNERVSKLEEQVNKILCFNRFEVDPNVIKILKKAAK